MGYILDLPMDEGLALIARAKDQEREARLHLQWAVQLPFMDRENPVSFADYKAMCTGANLDLRPTAEILAEIEAIEAGLRGDANGA